VAGLERQLARRPSDVLRGQLAGLDSASAPPLRRAACDGSDAYRAGLLAGTIYARFVEERGAVPETLLAAAGIYAASLAQAAAEARFEEPSPQALVREHTAACIRVAWQGRSLGEADEEVLFAWLAAALGVPLTDELRAEHRRMRARRLERLAADRS
jgi:hypothetical protein